jgi:hypothetical protein
VVSTGAATPGELWQGALTRGRPVTRNLLQERMSERPSRAVPFSLVTTRLYKHDVTPLWGEGVSTGSAIRWTLGVSRVVRKQAGHAREPGTWWAMQGARAHGTPLCFPFRRPLRYSFSCSFSFPLNWSPVWLQVKVKNAHARGCSLVKLRDLSLSAPPPRLEGGRPLRTSWTSYPLTQFPVPPDHSPSVTMPVVLQRRHAIIG